MTSWLPKRNITEGIWVTGQFQAYRLSEMPTGHIKHTINYLYTRLSKDDNIAWIMRFREELERREQEFALLASCWVPGDSFPRPRHNLQWDEVSQKHACTACGMMYDFGRRHI